MLVEDARIDIDVGDATRRDFAFDMTMTMRDGHGMGDATPRHPIDSLRLVPRDCVFVLRIAHDLAAKSPIAQIARGVLTQWGTQIGIDLGAEIPALLLGDLALYADGGLGTIMLAFGVRDANRALALFDRAGTALSHLMPEWILLPRVEGQRHLLPISLGGVTVALQAIARGSTLVLGLNPDALDREARGPDGAFLSGLLAAEERAQMERPSLLAMHGFGVDLLGSTFRGIPLALAPVAAHFDASAPAALFALFALEALSAIGDAVFDATFTLELAGRQAGIHFHVGAL